MNISSLVSPAYNEADNISSTLEKIESYMNGFVAREWEVIVVNDGSSDGTVGVLKELGYGKKWLTVIDLKGHYGRGRALRRGFKEAREGIIVSLDADLSYAPYHMGRMVEKMGDENADSACLGIRKGRNGKERPIQEAMDKQVGQQGPLIHVRGKSFRSYVHGEGLQETREIWTRWGYRVYGETSV